MKHLIGILLAFLIFSCEKEEPVELLPVDSAIRIEVTEDSREGGPAEFTLVFTTVKEFPCLGYTLVTDKEVEDGFFTFSLEGVRPPKGNCLAAIGPAMTIVPLGSLAIGEYKIEVLHEGFSSEGSLAITEEEITLSFPGQEAVVIPYPRGQR